MLLRQVIMLRVRCSTVLYKLMSLGSLGKEGELDVRVAISESSCWTVTLN